MQPQPDVKPSAPAGEDAYRDGMTADDMTDEEKRRDQLLAAPDAVESDADPRIDVTRHDGVTRIDIRDDAPVRPGGPHLDQGAHEADAS